MTSFAISPALDPKLLHELFARTGRLQITNFLAQQGAERLHRLLRDSEDWRLAVNRGEQILDFSKEALAAMRPDQLAKLSQAVAAGGRYGFQYCYDTIRLPSEEAAGAVLGEFQHFLSTDESLAFLRTLTGMADVTFVDAHASRYREHHFLAAHDDRSEGMGRRAAYVLNLSPQWRPDWGGLLLFHDAQGNVARGFTPAFNTLNIFAVPQAHSVSWVTPLAAHPRIAVTGWLRTGTPPA